MSAFFAAAGVAAAVLVPSVASAAPPRAPQSVATATADGRMYGHLPYGDVSPLDLVVAPRGFSIGATCRINRAVAPDLDRLLATAAATHGVGNALRGISCHRSVARQTAVFCHGRRHAGCVDAIDRAISVAPPGYSEHATGYAIDFGVRPLRTCADVSYCFASTPAGQWLLAHAPDYGFELSFPSGNQQGVTWEPWHWRWVGTSLDAPGASTARQVFARARSLFPALPTARDVLAANADAAPLPIARGAVVGLGLPDISKVKVRRR